MGNGNGWGENWAMHWYSTQAMAEGSRLVRRLYAASRDMRSPAHCWGNCDSARRESGHALAVDTSYSKTRSASPLRSFKGSRSSRYPRELVWQRVLCHFQHIAQVFCCCTGYQSSYKLVSNWSQKGAPQPAKLAPTTSTTFLVAAIALVRLVRRPAQSSNGVHGA